MAYPYPNPPCLTCGHDYDKHVTKGFAGGTFYCRVEGCDCVVYVKKAVLTDPST